MDEKVVIDIDLRLKQADAAKTVKDYKKEIKELKSAALQLGDGTAGFEKLTKKAAELQDALQDVNEAVAIQGSGVERLTASFKMMGDGLLSADPTKFTTGLKAAGAAMSAIPIFLLIEGVKLLIENFDEIVKSFQVADAQAGALTSTLQSLNDMLTVDLETNKKLIDNSNLQTQIAIENAKQRGATEKEINEIVVEGNRDKVQKLKQQEAALRGQLEGIQEGFYKRTEKMSEEDYKKAKENLDNLVQAHKNSKEEILKVQNENFLEQEKNDTAAIEKAKEKAKEATKKAEDDRRKLAEATIANIKDEKQREIAAENEKWRQLQVDNKGNLDLLEQLRIKHFDNVASIIANSETKEKEANDKAAAEEFAAKEKANAELIKQAQDFSKKNADFDKDEKKERYEEEKRLTDHLKSENDKRAKEAKEAYEKNIKIIQASFAAINSAISGVGELSKTESQNRINQLTNESTVALEEAELQSQTEMVAIENQKNLELTNLDETTSARLANENLTAEEKEKINNEYDKKKSELENRAAKRAFETEQASAQAKYQIELQKYHTETEIKKKAFESDKRLRIAQAAIAGASGVVGMMASPGSVATLGIAGGIAAAALLVTTGLQIAAIASQQFDAGSAPTPPPPVAPPSFSSLDKGTGSDKTNKSVPNFDLFGTAGTKNNVGSDSDREINVNAQVSITEVTSTAAKVEKYQTASEL